MSSDITNNDKQRQALIVLTEQRRYSSYTALSLHRFLLKTYDLYAGSETCSMVLDEMARRGMAEPVGNIDGYIEYAIGPVKPC